MKRRDTMKVTWSDLFAIGNVIRVTVKRPGLRTPKLLSDFGLIGNGAKLGTDGHWKLVPQKELKEIDRIGRDVRNIVDLYSVPFPLVPGGMFVPDKFTRNLLSKLTEMEEEYRNEVDKFIKKYPELCEEQLFKIREYVKRINPAMNPRETIARVLSETPPVSTLKIKFGISWWLFRFQVFTGVAIEKEEDIVRDVIIQLIEEIKELMLKEIIRVMTLITPKRSTSFSMKSINVGYKACERFNNKNVFEDPFIENLITVLRSLLKTMENERKKGISKSTVLGLRNLQTKISNSDTQEQANKAIRKISGKGVIPFHT